MVVVPCGGGESHCFHGQETGIDAVSPFHSGWGPSSWDGATPHSRWVRPSLLETPSLGLGPIKIDHQRDGGVGNHTPSCPASSMIAPSLRLWPLAGLSPSVQTLSLSITPAQTAAWRKQIFQQLTERTKRELESFRHYEQAVEQVGPDGTATLFLCVYLEIRSHCAPALAWNSFCIPG